MRPAWLLAAALAVGSLGGCKKDEGVSNRPKPISEAERKRGQDACHAYIDRLCACAKAKPADTDLAGRCELKKAKLDALRLALEASDDPGTSPTDMALAQQSARDVIAKCIEENAKLDASCL